MNNWTDANCVREHVENKFTPVAIEYRGSIQICSSPRQNIAPDEFGNGVMITSTASSGRENNDRTRNENGQIKDRIAKAINNTSFLEQCDRVCELRGHLLQINSAMACSLQTLINGCDSVNTMARSDVSQTGDFSLCPSTPADSQTISRDYRHTEVTEKWGIHTKSGFILPHAQGLVIVAENWWQKYVKCSPRHHYSTKYFTPNRARSDGTVEVAALTELNGCDLRRVRLQTAYASGWTNFDACASREDGQAVFVGTPVEVHVVNYYWSTRSNNDFQVSKIVTILGLVSPKWPKNY